jgi:hypothetical protein
MSDTISGTYTSGITLTGSPATFASSASVGNSAASGIAVTGPSGTAWTLTNLGTVAETGSGAGIGVSLANAGTVINAGTISGNTTASGGAGIALAQGGVVTNQAGGTIGGYAGIVALGASTVENAGTISGTTAVSFSAGYTNSLIDDPGATFIGTVDGGNTIGGSYASTLELSSAAGTGTLSGLGTQFVNFAQTTIDAGATWALIGNETVSAGATLTNSGTLIDSQITLSSASLTNQSSGMMAIAVYGDLSGSDNVVNQGTIAVGNAIAIDLQASGSVTNAVSGSIISGGVYGVLIGAFSTVSNLGLISQTYVGSDVAVELENGGVVTNGQGGSGTSTASIVGYYGVAIVASAASTGTVTNYGSIIGTGGIGVSITSGGAVVDNGPSGATSALIQGAIFGVYVTGGGTVANYGTIIATGTTNGEQGVYLEGTGNISNLGSASLIEGFYGILVHGTAVITNAGTIASNRGTSGVAIQFNEVNGRVVVDPGAVFIGTVNGGEISHAVVELASGSSAGTLSGFGTEIFNFYTLAFDPNARWTAIGNTAAFTTMTTTGFAAGDTIDLTGVAAVSETFANNALVLTDGSNAHTTLAIQGTFATSDFLITPDGTGGTDITLVGDLVYGQTVDDTGIVAASETVSAGVMTLFNAGTTAVGSVIVGTSLSTGDFRLVSDGAGGTDIVVHTAFGSYANSLTLLVNPTTIGSLASIAGTSANAVGVAGPLGTNWTLTNLGTVSESGTASIGVSFASAGTITNATGGIIAAGEQAGSDVGVSLAAGGYVNSQSGGTITGSIAIQVSGAAATIMNAGSIAGSDFFGAGITLGAGGSVTNLAGGTITGNYGVSAVSVAATVVNDGYLAGGYSLPSSTGIVLKNGGDVTNQSQGTIKGDTGIYFSGATGTLINAGKLHGIYEPNGGDGLVAAAGGAVTNQAGGIIAGYNGVQSLTSAFTAVNAGTIRTDSLRGAGINLAAGGSVINQSGGSVTGFTGVQVSAGTTVENAGSIGGITAAVSFASGAGNRLLVDPGAIFTGSVNGGNTIGGSAVSTLELTAGTGTLTGFGTQFVNFAQTTIDAGANWALSGSDSVVAGSTVTVSGSLRGTGTLTNSGTIDNTGGNLASHYGVLLASGGIFTNLGSASLTEGRVGLGLSTNDTVSNFGTIASTQGTTGVAIKFSTGDTLIDNPGAVFTGSIQATGSSVLELASGSTAGTISGLGTSVTNFGTVLFNPGAEWTVVGNGGSSGLGGGMPIEGFAVGDTIDLTGFSAVSRSFASNALTLNNGSIMQTLDIQGSLTTNNFLIAPDGSGGTDITLQNLVPPVITGTSAVQTVGDNATDRPFSAVTISDANFGPQSETVTITLTAANVATDTDGTLSGSGLTRTGTGSYTLTAASPAAAATALEALVFTPTPHQVVPGNAVTTGFTLAVTDLDAESATDSTTTVLATAVNDPPVITGTVAGQTETDAATIRPFSGVTIADPDLGASETVSITLKDGGIATDSDGVLAGSGLTKTGTGSYTLAARTPSAVTAALRTLVFVPVTHTVAPGQTVTTAMALSVTDGIVSSPTIDNTTSVITTDLVPCFAAGTRIATPRGPVPVERLREGDVLLTLSGRPRAIQWIGTRTVDCRRHAHPERVRPIRIAAHAFGENRPARPLFLSPDHSVFVEDVLIPVKHLVNNTTIAPVSVRTVTYYHIELPAHDVVLAEGLPTESYLETGGRNAFENGGGAIKLHPDFAPDEARVAMVWQNFGYAPLIGSDGELERVQGRLALQAVMLGYAPDQAKRKAGRR